MKKGQFLKTILIHNLVFVDLLFIVSIIILTIQGNNPNSLLKSAIIFYGCEGILGAAIKIVKVRGDEKKKQKESENEKENQG